jgi:hypothetical protein
MCIDELMLILFFSPESDGGEILVASVDTTMSNIWDCIAQCNKPLIPALAHLSIHRYNYRVII